MLIPQWDQSNFFKGLLINRRVRELSNKKQQFLRVNMIHIFFSFVMSGFKSAKRTHWPLYFTTTFAAKKVSHVYFKVLEKI